MILLRHSGSPANVPKKSRLTHLDSRGRAHMVDVGAKPVTHRIAIASGRITMGAEAFARLRENRADKGAVLAVARIAGIQAAKRASDLIPLAHPLAITRVAIDFELDARARSARVTARVECRGRTGVEMEALAASAAALLTVYDMLKAVDRGMTIGELRLDEKRGGKSGGFRRREL
jgi:cyclic pyranopterin phosphate synthase